MPALVSFKDKNAPNIKHNLKLELKLELTEVLSVEKVEILCIAVKFSCVMQLYAIQSS